MKEIKQLASDTLLYGIGTVIPRFLNWLLVPLYTRKVFIPEEYGIITEFYAYIMVLLIILTYGMETGFFRYIEKSNEKNKVYSTSIISLFASSLFFIIIIFLFVNPISRTLGYHNHKEYITLVALIVSIDAFCNIPFAYLRQQRKALRFAVIKIVNVSLIIGFNLLFYLVFPNIHEKYKLIQHVYNPEYKIIYVFIANLIGSVVTLLLLLPEIFKATFSFSILLWKKMIKYSFPLLIAGLAGIVNEALDRILLKYLLPDNSEPLYQLGIYGANIKIAVLMMLFIQMFRYAFEPFFFKYGNDANSKKMYAIITKYFTIFSLFIFLGIVFYIDIIKFFIGSEYHEGLKIIPVLLIANIFLGLYVNLSVWYKLNNLTRYGAYITILGAIITLSINFAFIPRYGYEACAFARLACYATMVIVSYLLSTKFEPIPYEKLKIFLYFAFALGLFFIQTRVVKYIEISTLQYIFNTIMLFIFIFVIDSREKIIKQLIQIKTRNESKDSK